MSSPYGRLAIPEEENIESHSFPLSHGQQRLWLLDRLAPQNCVYNIGRAVRLRGRLEVHWLEDALARIVHRHEVMRTRFVLRREEPEQVVEEARAVQIEMEDLSGFNEIEREDEAKKRTTNEAHKGFDLERGPMWRVKLLRLSEEEHILVLVFHHIVTDGWSMGLLFKELGELYNARAEKRAARLGEIRWHYRQYAHWQRERLCGGALTGQMEYWRKQLEKAPGLELPTDRPRPRVQTYAGTQYWFEIEQGTTKKLGELSRSEGVTLFMTMLAAFDVLLHRYSGQTDIVVGTPTASRNRQEIENLIGVFVNALALRTCVYGGLSFRELLARVREVALDAYVNQDVPFDSIVQELAPDRDLSRSPLFQVMFMLQNMPPAILQMAGLQVDVSPIVVDAARFDLTVSLMETGQRLECTVEYNTDLFEAQTIQRLMSHYQVLLQSILRQPRQRISELQLMTQIERNQLLLEWNQTALEYPRNSSIQRMFEDQAERTPENIAILFQEQRFSYRALNSRANQAARFLRRLGLGPECRVGILLPRSAEMVIALLGVLKAGAAYVPLDSRYPRERLRFAVQDGNLQVVITSEEFASLLPDCDTKFVDLTDAAIASESSANPEHVTQPENLAYLIYTSGSTGRPKAVAIEHRNAVAFLHWAHAAFAPGNFAGMLASTSICFDLSIFELFATLTCGGTVILTEDALALLALPQPQRVTLVNTVPSAMAELVRLDAVPASVQIVNLAGEPLPGKLVKEIYASTSVERVFNLYGPSEGTTYSTYVHVLADADHVSIGRPIDNTEVYVLNRGLEPAPIGVAGELYIGGAGVARGYLGQAGLTAERFVPHLYSERPGERLYRTGDLARYGANGELEFLGRTDHQVKIRGYRIELGEIEAALRQQEGVREAVVVVREEGAGDQRLLGYVVWESQEPFAARELKARLRQSLPEYMVPGTLVRLERMPLNPSGKVDRKALPGPEDAGGEERENLVAPRTATEEIVAGIWGEVLKREGVGEEDNFFEMGGHSLLAMQVISRVEEVLECEVSLRAVFEQPTVSRFARSVEEARRVARKPARSVGSGKGEEGPVPLSFSQERLWFLDRLEPGSAFYNIAAGLRLRGRLEVKWLEEAWRRIVERHEALRTRFMLEGEGPVQVVEAAGGVELEVVDLRGWEEEKREIEAARQAGQEAQQGFDLESGPMWRMKLLRLGEQEHVLLLVLHHIVADGWSLGLLFGELSELYRARREGREAKLEELRWQYRDYARWQREWLQGEVLGEQMEYWRKQLSGAPGILELPVDRARPPVQSYRGGHHRFVINTETTKKLKELSRREGVTLFMTLLAVLDILLHHSTGQTDILVLSPTAGRNRPEIRNLVGFFANSLPLRNHVEKDWTMGQLFTHVRKTCLAAYENSDLPYQKLHGEVTAREHGGIGFVLGDAPLDALSLAGLECERMALETGAADFDIILSTELGKNGISGIWQYNSDLFDRETIVRFAQQYERLLEQIVAHPERRIGELSLLREEERQRVLVEWNGTEMEYEQERCIHELFEEQAERRPGAVAVEFGDLQLSYGELERRTNQLARYLREAGVGPEEVVGIWQERSLEMVESVLAVLKAGGAYLPVDEECPQERVKWMLEEAGVKVLLTEKERGEGLEQAGWQGRRLDVKREWEQIAGRSRERLKSGVCAGNLAYVIYTSGSTGRPKGVQVQHGGIVNMVAAMRGPLQVVPEDRVLQFTSLSFDISVCEMWLALGTGAGLVLGKKETMRSVSKLRDLLQRHEVSLATLLPSLIEVLNPAELPELRKLVAGGDRVPAQIATEWSNGRLFFNGYGVTEQTVAATLHRCEGECEQDPPIGKAIANTQVYVLDEEMQLVPVGVAGELYIGGAGLGRGYTGRPDLTAERYVPNPYGKAGERLYRTGDLGRWQRDGAVEFIGRKDDMVKVRGYRIELGEIEAALRRLPGVRVGAAVVREESGGEKRLVGYVVWSGEESYSGQRLREQLRQSLPEYMVPAVLVKMEQMPLNSNGKIDRKALPAPDWRSEEQTSYVPPRTSAEETVAAIWMEILGLLRVGVEDNFFDVGGHSLAMTRIHERIQQRFGRKFELVTMFEHPTISALAKYLASNGSEPQSFDQINRRAENQMQRRKHKREQRRSLIR